MTGSVKSVFNEECGDIKIDTKLVKRILQYGQNFVNKNADHIAFFGGNLLGVDTVRFKDADRNQWFDDILEADDISLKGKLHSLPSIDPNFKVSSDVMNLSCVWLMNAIYTSKQLGAGDKETGLMSVALILQYKLISSIMAHYFPYPADREVALATYASLSRKFALKVYGSWGALLRKRSEDILARNSIHYKTYTEMNDDAAVVYMLNDIQGRLREIVKKMWAEFDKTRNSKSKISSTSSVIVIDGESILRDRSTDHTAYRRYIHETIINKPTFIKTELVEVIGSAMHTMPIKLLNDTLAYMSDNYRQRGDKDIEELLDETLLHAFDFLNSNRSELRDGKDIAGFIARLRTVYMSSRSTDPALLKMRALAEKIIGKAVKTKNDNVIASVRTGVLLYIVLRSFTMKHYS